MFKEHKEVNDLADSYFTALVFIYLPFFKNWQSKMTIYQYLKVG